MGKQMKKNAIKMYIKSSGNHIHDIGLDMIPFFSFWGAIPGVNFFEDCLTGTHEINIDIR